jgi:ATP-dependent Clp protease protease subunit
MSDGSNEDIIVSDFTEQSAKQFRKQIIAKVAQDPGSPIIVYIDSYGGLLDSLNSMLETIEQISVPIITVCLGKAMSCGAVLLAAGDHRFCGRFSRVMIHQSTGGDYGPVENLQKNVDECKRMNDMFMAFLAKRCGKSLNDLKQIIKNNESRDLYLDAKDSLRFGIVDAIGLPLIKPMVMYHIEVAAEKTYKKSATIDSVKELKLKKNNRPDKNTKRRQNVKRNKK